ncbi:MAG: MarR family transcriptional regulator [Bacteriovorax sp.]|nr:MarR family transcriptional regulator [Bacteriovorax sp.]
MSTNEILDAFAMLRKELGLIRAAELKAFDFGPTQMLILFQLSRSTATMGELAEYALVDKAAMTRVVASLEKSGLVKRFTHETDLRITVIELTTKGKAKAREAEIIRENIGKKVNSTLSTEERKELTRLLTKAATVLCKKRN